MKYKHILLIDDDADDTEVFVMEVKTIDSLIKCKLENNALNAFKNLNSAKKLPDIIFLDFCMPDLGDIKELYI